MKIEITPTLLVTEIYGQKMRIWQGTTNQGTDCNVYVPLIGIFESAAGVEFDHFGRDELLLNDDKRELPGL